MNNFAGADTTQLTFGVDTFGELSDDDAGVPLSHAESIRNIVEQAVEADRVGLEHFAIGEHHITEMPISVPDVILAAIASRTSSIRLGSGVTVLGSDDPVRVFQRYATLDAVSSGRAELIVGRGSSVESFPLYGYKLDDYEVLFEEKLELFAQLLDERPVTWSGTTRAALPGLPVFPHTGSRLPVWVGVGGTPASVVRAARHRMHLMLAIIGGNPARFAPLTELFETENAQRGTIGARIGVHSPGHVAATDEQAMTEYWPYYRDFLPEKRRARGIPDPTPESFRRAVGPTGSLYVGSPATVAEKIIRTMTVLRATRFDLKYGVVGLHHDALVEAIRLFGTDVVPQVREALQNR